MKFSKLLVAGLLSLGSIAFSAIPGMARPGFIYSDANVRSEPSIKAARIDGLPTGTPLEISRIYMGWYYVRSMGQFRTEGWVSSTLVRFEQSDRQYGNLVGDLGDVINIRSSPNLESAIKHTGTTGDLVEVNEIRFVSSNQLGRTGHYWYKVTYPNGASGWVRGDLIAVWPGPDTP